MSFLLLSWRLILAQVDNPEPGQAASTITEDGIAASEAVAQSIDRLWDDVLGGGLYSAIREASPFGLSPTWEYSLQSVLS